MSVGVRKDLNDLEDLEELEKLEDPFYFYFVY